MLPYNESEWLWITKLTKTSGPSGLKIGKKMSKSSTKTGKNQLRNS